VQPVQLVEQEAVLPLRKEPERSGFLPQPRPLFDEVYQRASQQAGAGRIVKPAFGAAAGCTCSPHTRHSSTQRPQAGAGAPWLGRIFLDRL